jgi:hypothetical protein
MDNLKYRTDSCDMALKHIETFFANHKVTFIEKVKPISSESTAQSSVEPPKALAMPDAPKLVPMKDAPMNGEQEGWELVQGATVKADSEASDLEVIEDSLPISEPPKAKKKLMEADDYGFLSDDDATQEATQAF